VIGTRLLLISGPGPYFHPGVPTLLGEQCFLLSRDRLWPPSPTFLCTACDTFCVPPLVDFWIAQWVHLAVVEDEPIVNMRRRAFPIRAFKPLDVRYGVFFLRISHHWTKITLFPSRERGICTLLRANLSPSSWCLSITLESIAFPRSPAN